MVIAAELVGVPRPLVPASVAELGQYVAAVRPELRCTPAAAESMAYLLDPLPKYERRIAGWSCVILITAGLATSDDPLANDARAFTAVLLARNSAAVLGRRPACPGLIRS